MCALSPAPVETAPRGACSVPCPTTSCLRGVGVKAGTVLRTGWGGGGQAWALHERAVA